MKVTFRFFHPIARDLPLVVEMSVPPNVGDTVSHSEQLYRVESRGWSFDPNGELLPTLVLRAVMT